MFNTDYKLLKKWEPILEHRAFEKIPDSYRRAVTARILENYERDSKTQSVLLEAPSAPVNRTGPGIQNYDPVLISLLRRTMPNLIAYDVCSVQPLSAPNSLIFALRARYDSQTGPEALYFEAETGFSARGGDYTFNPLDPATPSERTQRGDNPAVLNETPAGDFDYATGMSTSDAEALGSDPTVAFRDMAFTIEKISVGVKSRALKAEYSIEMAQDYKAIHGGDAEAELTNILASEILAEINREIIRTIYVIALPGAQNNVATPGTFNMDVDANGRWMVEKFKGLMFQIERDANAIAQLTRRGKGNMLIVSADVGSALAMAGYLDYQSALEKNKLKIDDTGPTYAGVLNGQFKVYIDPYAANISNNHFYVVGYKGNNPYDAGLFYCPYIPLQIMKAIDPNTFQPKVGFKTRYGVVQNPFVLSNVTTGTPLGENLQPNRNMYYRRVRITNLM